MFKSSVGCCYLRKKEKEKPDGTPNDEMSVGAAIAMTTGFTVDEKYQQRDSTFVYVFVLFCCFKAEMLTVRAWDKVKSDMHRETEKST